MTKTSPIADHYDAIVVGARCAGAATAMLLARQGARVLLVDRAAPGTDTMSTHALMRGAVMQLDRWGLLPDIIAAGTPAIRTTTFQYGDQQIPLQIRPAHGVDALYAPRRTVLDPVLVEGARCAGADIRFGVSFDDVLRNLDGRVVGAVLTSAEMGKMAVHADIVIGADGRRSRVARQVAAQTLRQARNSVACAFAYYDGIEDAGSHWLFAPQLGGGRIPTNNGQHCLFAALPADRFRREIRGSVALDPLCEVLAAADPAYRDMLEHATRATPMTLFGGQVGHIRQSWGDGWALVGDAAYFKDPLTAHGITDALRDAQALAVAVLSGARTALARYQQERDRISTELFEISDEIAGFSWDMPRLQHLHMQLNAAMKREQAWMVGDEMGLAA